MLRMGDITMQGARILYTATLEGLMLESDYGKINDLIDTDVILIIHTISTVVNLLSIIALIFCAKCDKWINRMQVLKRYTIEKHKNAQIQTEEFRAEFATSLHCENGEEQPKVIRNQLLYVWLLFQQQQPDNMHPQGYTEVN